MANQLPIPMRLSTLSRMIYDFTYTYQAYDPTSFKTGLLTSRTTAMVWQVPGSWARPLTDPNLNFGVAPLPVVDPEDPATYQNVVTGGWSVNANKSDEQQQLAQDFWPSSSVKRVKSNSLSTGSKTWDLPSLAMLSSNPKGIRQRLRRNPCRIFDKSYEMFNTEYLQHSYDLAGAALNRAIDRVIYDGMSAQETADLLQRELHRLQ